MAVNMSTTAFPSTRVMVYFEEYIPAFEMHSNEIVGPLRTKVSHIVYFS
jgi:hypothetical protein